MALYQYNYCGCILINMLCLSYFIYSLQRRVCRRCICSGVDHHRTLEHSITAENFSYRRSKFNSPQSAHSDRRHIEDGISTAEAVQTPCKNPATTTNSSRCSHTAVVPYRKPSRRWRLPPGTFEGQRRLARKTERLSGADTAMDIRCHGHRG